MSSDRYMDLLITFDGFDEVTIPLSYSGSRITAYVPKDESGKIVTETIEFVNTTSVVAGRAQKGQIDQFFTLARQASKNASSPRTYLRKKDAVTDDLYRSEVLDGNVVLLHSTQSIEWKAGQLKFLLTVTRQNFFEAEEDVSLPVNDSIEGTPIDIYYAYLGGNNTLWVNKEDILGDLPAPIMLVLEHTSETSGPQTEFWFGHNIFSTPLTFDNPGESLHMLEGEASAACAGVTKVDQSDSDCSGGEYAEITWESTAETELVEWALEDWFVNRCRGGRFGAILRLQDQHGYTDLYLRLIIKNDSGTIWQSDQVLVPDTITFWLDNYNLPPLREHLRSDQTDYMGEIKIVLCGQRVQSGTHTINLDYIQNTPISEQSGLTKFTSLSSGVAFEEVFVADEARHEYYRRVIGSPSRRYTEFTKSGKGLYILPGFDQVFFVLSCFSDYDSGYVQLSQTYNASASYRPRRRSI